MSKTKSTAADCEIVAGLDLVAQDGRACTLSRTPYDVAEGQARADILKIKKGASVRAVVQGKTIISIKPLPRANDPAPVMEDMMTSIKGCDITSTPCTPIASCNQQTYASPLAEVHALDEQIAEAKKILKAAETRRKELCEAAHEAGFTSDGRYSLVTKTVRTRHVDALLFAREYPEAFCQAATVSVTKAEELVGKAALDAVSEFTESYRYTVTEIPTDPRLAALAMKKGWITA